MVVANVVALWLNTDMRCHAVYGPALAQMMETIAEMQRVQREANNRLQAQGAHGRTMHIRAAISATSERPSPC